MEVVLVVFFEEIILYMPGKFWFDKTKIWPFLAKIDCFESFWLITFKRSYESSYFLVGKFFLCFSLWKSYSICRENSDMAEFWPFKTKIWPFFGENWLFWEFLTYNFQTQLWIFLVFGMEIVFMVFFEKIIPYMPGKFWYFRILVDQNLAIFWPILTILRVFGL